MEAEGELLQESNWKKKLWWERNWKENELKENWHMRKAGFETDVGKKLEGKWGMKET